MMSMVFINERSDYIFESPGNFDAENLMMVIKREQRKKEKHTRERDWKQMSRQNYRKR